MLLKTNNVKWVTFCYTFPTKSLKENVEIAEKVEVIEEISKSLSRLPVRMIKSG